MKSIKKLSRNHVWMYCYILMIGFVLSGCANEKMIQTEIYFGLSNSDGDISEKQWNSFRIKTMDKFFDGYTVVDCKGFWTSSSGQSVHENSKMIIYLHKDDDLEFRKIDSVIYAYKTQFKQESVLEINKEVDASFK